MGCCDFEPVELSLYKIVMQVKEQYRTKKQRLIPCHLCQTPIEHQLVKKRWLGSIVQVRCPKCAWSFEG